LNAEEGTTEARLGSYLPLSKYSVHVVL